MMIGVVAEGVTDFEVLSAVIRDLCPGDHLLLPLQPDSMFPEYGQGWKGVRRWCQMTWQTEGSSLALLLSGATGPPLDLLVIHLDGEIAAESDLQEDLKVPLSVPNPLCPPISNTYRFLEEVLLQWLNLTSLPSNVFLAMPAQDTETWVFAALYPGDPTCSNPDFECTHPRHSSPGFKLTLKDYGKRFERTGDGIKKSRGRYAKLLPSVISQWNEVCILCSQARQFTGDIQDRVGKHEPHAGTPAASS